MSDDMKLIIEIPKSDYEAICANKEDAIIAHDTCRRIANNGIPLDSDSERAETQAYFAGEAYGWEQGRKALIDDVTAEVEQLRAYSTRFITSDGRAIYTDGQTILDILANMGKTESEDTE